MAKKKGINYVWLNFNKTLQDFGRGQVSDAQAGLSGSSSSGSLEKSLSYGVRGGFGKQPVVTFEMNDYGGFVDTGVTGTGDPFKSGKMLIKKRQLNSTSANDLFGFDKQPAFSGRFKMINTRAIDKWVIQKGLGGTRDAKGRFVSRSAVKMAVATAIYKQGLRGTGFFSEPFYDNVDAFKPIIENALVKDYLYNFKKINKYFV